MADGVIIKALSGFYYVHNPDGTFCCKARGRFRKEHISPLVGDCVHFTAAGDGTGTLDEVFPRKNEFVRPPVANLDVMVLIVSAALPVTDPFLLDRMLFIAELKGCEAIICFNKWDVKQDEAFFAIYEHAGFPVFRTSAESGEGLEQLRRAILGKSCAFTGNSGVGKSSILNALAPGLDIAVGGVSEKLGRGRHTTRHVEFFPLPGHTYIADTPGFSSFDIEQMALKSGTDTVAAFREFRPYLGNCRYTDCSHTKEDGCAVLEALRAGKISSSRHESYMKIREYVKTLKPWQE